MSGKGGLVGLSFFRSASAAIYTPEIFNLLDTIKKTSLNADSVSVMRRYQGFNRFYFPTARVINSNLFFYPRMNIGCRLFWTINFFRGNGDHFKRIFQLNFPFCAQVFSDRRYQNRFLLDDAGFDLFYFSRMVSAARRYMISLFLPDAYSLPGAEAAQTLPLVDVVEDIGLARDRDRDPFLYWMGYCAHATRGYSDLEYILVGISLVMVLTAAVIAFVMTNRCYDMKCEEF